MARSISFTSVVLLAALVTGCSAAEDAASHARAGQAGAPGHLPPGVDPASDDDGDGVPAARDLCLDSEPGQASGADGCAAHEDGDEDGLPTDQDLCPGTPKGEPVDADGCSESQKASGSGSEASKDNIEAGKNWSNTDDGKVAGNGFATFILDPKGAFPVVLRTLAKNVKTLASGFELSGTVLMQVPGDEQVKLLEAKVTLAYDAAKGEGLQSFQGTCRLPFPDFGFMAGVTVDDLAYAYVGYDLGKNIESLDAPIKDERKYFFFNFSAGLSAQVSNTTVSVGPGVSTTMTLDPSDPAFFLKGAFGGLLGPVEEASLGLSLGGHLPFTPTTTWGIESQAGGFDGHLWVGGKVNLVKIPVSIGGNTVIDLDPNDDGKTVFTDPADGIQWGSNSELSISLAVKVISLELPIANATIIGRIAEHEGYGYYSGELKAGHAFDGLLPITNTQTLKVAGHASSKLGESYFKAQGNLSLNATTLGQWTGLDIGELAMVQVNLDANKDGVLLKGMAGASFSPLLGLDGQANVEAFFNGEPNDWYVTLDGKLAVKGIDLSADAHAKLNKNGIAVHGQMTTPISKVAMAGQIDKNGVNLSGNAEVTIPIVAGKEIVQWVTDAAVCGYETVTDAAVCGYQTVTDGAKCGTKMVTDAASCGTKVVTDSATCGSKYVTSGAQCGYKTVTSATLCGVKYVDCGWNCVTSGFKKCKCEEAKSCQVAASCWVAQTCSVTNTCPVANTCSVPASCEKVKSCEQKTVVPDFDYGSFKGAVTVKIGNQGLYGDVSGQYCTPANSCVTLVGGRIDTASGTPKACVTVPGLGEFCGQF